MVLEFDLPSEFRFKSLGDNVFEFEAPSFETKTKFEITASDGDGSNKTQTTVFEVLEDEQVPVPPKASFEIFPKVIYIGAEAMFVSTSTPGDHPITDYEWYLDGEFIASGESIRYSFEEAGEYEMTLRIIDESGRKDKISKLIKVFNNPDATELVADIEVRGGITVGTEVKLDGSKSSPLQNITRYVFQIQRFGEIITEIDSSSPITYFTPQERGAHMITLTVYDGEGNSAVDTSQLDVSRDTQRTQFGDFEGLHVSNIEILGSDVLELSFDDPFSVYATVTNNRETAIDDLRLTFTVPEIGFKVKGNSFSLAPGESLQRSIHRYLPEHMQDFPYDDIVVFVGVSGSGFDRNIHVPVDISN
jgi:hypothetical protein